MATGDRRSESIMKTTTIGRRATDDEWSTYRYTVDRWLYFCNQRAVQIYGNMCDKICDENVVEFRSNFDFDTCRCRNETLSGVLCDEQICRDSSMGGGSKYFCLKPTSSSSSTSSSADHNRLVECSGLVDARRTYPECPGSCLNGGYSVAGGGGCRCFPGYSGRHCEIHDTTTSTPHLTLPRVPTIMDIGDGSTTLMPPGSSDGNFAPAIALPVMVLCMIAVWFICRTIRRAREESELPVGVSRSERFLNAPRERYPSITTTLGTALSPLRFIDAEGQRDRNHRIRSLQAAQDGPPGLEPPSNLPVQDPAPPTYENSVCEMNEEEEQQPPRCEVSRQDSAPPSYEEAVKRFENVKR